MMLLMDVLKFGVVCESECVCVCFCVCVGFVRMKIWFVVVRLLLLSERKFCLFVGREWFWKDGSWV